MKGARWDEVKSVVGAALDAEDTVERTAVLDAACAGDASLRHEVESLLAHHTERLDACAAELSVGGTVEAATSRLEQRIGAYRIVRELGRGGMGAVYLAVRADDEYQKEVAIKLLKRGTDTDEVLRRFRAERQILARLEHPNIARLIDGGTTDDGLPYFVMEYVAGARITDYCFANSLSVRARLELFVKVCRAVQFAHQNLIVHRDLKPANILITAEGEPKLLDFGIAKLLDPTDAPIDVTAVERQRLTPAYASPEQVRAEPITTVSDVYAMGALLYELLAGSTPHRFSSAHPSATELFRVVAEVDPVRPSIVTAASMQRTRIASDLDRIVLKALRKEPRERYPGVGSLAEDIGRFLGGLPVRARAATFGYRARKFVGRNKAGVAAGAIAVVALLGGTIIATRNAHRAQTEARRAERHFQNVRQLANAFLFEFHDAIATLPGSTAARQLVVNRAQEYLDKLARESAHDPALQLELAEAYLKVGDVQGQPYTANLGDSAGAVRSYEKAAVIASAHAEASTSARATDARRIAATAYLHLASVQSRLKQLDDSSRNNARALAIGERLLIDDPARADEWRRLVVACEWGLGDSIQAGNHQRRDPELHRASLLHYRRALALAEQLAAAHPDSAADMMMLAKSCSRAAIVSELGATTGEQRLFDEALALHARAIEIMEVLLRRTPNDAQLRRRVGDALVMKAAAHVLAKRDLDTALRDCERALAVHEQLATADPSNAEAQQDLSYAHYNAGRVLQLLGDKPGAAAHFRNSMSILEPLVAANPQNAETAFDVERARRGLAETTDGSPES